LPQLNAQLPKAVVAILTNQPDREYRRRCMALGASYFFDKSTQFDKLLAALAELRR
jgi:DNA-binding NarL/FixJ family response regulator